MTIPQLRTELQQRARITARLAAQRGEHDLRAHTPVDTGNMAANTTVRDRPHPAGAMIEATVDTDYAQYVREGTRPHRIAAVNAQALRFDWRGSTVFFKSVNHPGTSPDPWVDEWARRMRSIVADTWRQVNR